MIPSPPLNIWAHTRNSLFHLYQRRAAGEAEELVCHAQAAEIYAPFYHYGQTGLDAGGGSGHFDWSLIRRHLEVHYNHRDYTVDYLKIAAKALASEKTPPTFIYNSIQQVSGCYQVVFCLNALFCLPDYRQGLEALLKAAENLIILRTTLADQGLIRFENDRYLDPGAENLKSYFNIWPIGEINNFVRDHGFQVSNPVDRRTGDVGEISAGKYFPWRWVVGIKK